MSRDAGHISGFFTEGELEEVPADDYLLPEQHGWTEADIQGLIDTAEKRCLVPSPGKFVHRAVTLLAAALLQPSAVN
jgi:hypothetical protein